MNHRKIEMTANVKQNAMAFAMFALLSIFLLWPVTVVGQERILDSEERLSLIHI